MDDLKLLRGMRSNLPPPSPSAFAAAEQRLVAATGARRRSWLRAGTGGRMPRLSQPLGRLAIAGGLSLAVACGALAEHEWQNARTVPGSHPVTAAWTVAAQPHGLVKITVRELQDAAGLQARLRSYGVAIRIQFVRHPFQVTTSPRDIPRSCTEPDLTNEAAAKLQSRIWPQYPAPGKNGVTRSSPGLIFVIRPSAIPPGIGIFFKAWVPGDPGLAGALRELNLVKSTPRCTG